MLKNKPPFSTEIRAYTRCSGGCFFATDFCPVDGWTSADTLRIKEAVRELELDGLPLNLPNLLAKGLSTDLLNHILIITFPPGGKPWDYFIPSKEWGCEKCEAPPDVW